MIYFSSFIIPFILSIIIFIGLKENKNVFELFCKGAEDGIKIAIKLFPTLIAIFLAIGILRESGMLDKVSSMLEILLKRFNVPQDVIPLAIIKPISGSAAMGMGMEIMSKFGTESREGMIAGTIMAASETTFYVIAVYTSSVKISNNKKILIPAILADIASIITAIIICR